jgi:UDP-N-acetylglucosamine 2-epimerase (non-hydrolysing)
MQFKVMSIFGTRPEAIKMAPVMKELKKYPALISSEICVTAQHRQILDQVLDLFSLRPDFDLDLMEEDQHLAEISARGLDKLDRLLRERKPELVLIQGDTTTAFITALAAFYNRVKVAHIEAGLRSYDKENPFPEEVNRRLISGLADLHFAPTEQARKNLLQEGIADDRISVTGNPVIDALLGIAKKRERFPDRFLEELKDKVILLTAHRRESFGRPLRNICLAAKEIALSHPEVKIIYPVHLNPNVQKVVFPLLQGIPNLHLISPLNYEAFVHLMKKSYLILTDSGGIQEEAPSLGKPVLVLREVSERPEVVEVGAARLVGTGKKRIVQEAERLLDSREKYERMAAAVNPYGDGKAAERIVGRIAEWLSSSSGNSKDLEFIS